MADLTPQQVLDLPMGKNDSGASTVRGYLVRLLVELWTEGDFSGKRPFGNSSWECDLYEPLIKAGAIEGSFDEDGYLDDCDDRAGDQVILAAIKSLDATS